jgi:hypothetical protein
VADQDLYHTEQVKLGLSKVPLYETDCFLGLKGGTAVAVRKGIPHNHVDLPPLVSVEAPGICIPIENKVLRATVYKPVV